MPALEPRPPVCLAQAGSPTASSGEAALAAWSLHHGIAVGLEGAAEIGRADAADAPRSVAADDAIAGVVADGVFVPLRTSESTEGVLYMGPVGGVDRAVRERPDPGLVLAVANLVAAAFQRQRLEEEAARAAALAETDRMKSTFVSALSHELKTPLAAATARVTGLLDEPEAAGAAATSRVRQELAAVAEDLSRLDASIGDLLDMSRLESDAWRPHLETQDVADVLGTLRSRLPSAQRERIEFVLGVDLPLLCCDFAQLVRALNILVENALAYSPVGAPVLVSAAAKSDSLEVSVEDRGPGVADSEKEAVFEKFYRGSASGSAPGTACAHRARDRPGQWRRHRGRGRGRGRRALRRIAAGWQLQDRGVAVGSPEKTTHVLVVDDEEQIRAALRSVLQSRHYAVEDAADAETGLVLATRSTPDIVILDLTLPGMSGLEACRQLREWYHGPILSSRCATPWPRSRHSIWARTTTSPSPSQAESCSPDCALSSGAHGLDVSETEIGIGDVISISGSDASSYGATRSTSRASSSTSLCSSRATRAER